MKKICILSTVNIKHMSLINLYTSFFAREEIQYDLIYVDKYNEYEKSDARKVFKYDLKINKDWSIVKKIWHYKKFRKYAKKILNKNEYDFIVVWNSFTTFLFFDYLIFKYSKRYSLNIRDYFKEKNPFIYFIHWLTIKNSVFTTISSSGFLSFLPKSDYHVIHSFNASLLDETSGSLVTRHSPLVISFIGYVRFYKTDKMLIDELGNDSRFILKFIGEGAEILAEYVKEKKYVNVLCIPGFQVEETMNLLSDADIINNLYGRNEIALDTAISIKFYYALHLKIPILTFKGTYVDELSAQLYLGISIDSLNGAADKIFKQYSNINRVELEKKCEDYLDYVFAENRKFESLLFDTFLARDN